MGAQPITVASGQPYGARAEQVAAQQAIPLARAEGFQPAPSGGGGGGGAPASSGGLSGPLPGQLVPLDAPSQRPDEPVTAGMAMGAGPGPEVLGPLAGTRESVADELRAIYARFPTEEMRSLLEALDDD